MNRPAEPTDRLERLRALDPQRSFIVQAPAGSGKTELLIQRYLALLARVQQPEEIAAITFTRKSAADMRLRVLQALERARGARPDEPNAALTWTHARAVLERAEERSWNLEQHAARLRTQTIDALCASLAAQMPVLALFGAAPRPIDDATALYREAARATLSMLDGSDAAVVADIASLLAHLDDNVAVAIDLTASMLARRDQWLRALVQGLDRRHLETGLETECALALARVDEAFAAAGLPLPVAGGVASFEARLAQWQAAARELLTQKETWRVRSPLAQQYKNHEQAELLRGALLELGACPPVRYSDAQWETLGAIARLLPVAVAQLKLLFAARAQADFMEIAQGALEALGEPEAPTDLMLALDYRIQHILVDEFQDTSFTQYALLKSLTAGWQAGDGRTLFLVGDPMQSIYRFREADVSLFLRARREGIGSLTLEPVTLSANFRSHAGIVDWVNGCFGRIMPAAEDPSAGAVPYAASQATRAEAALGTPGVRVHAFFDDDGRSEAQQVVELAAAARAGGGTTAVLVRNRAHLDEIVPALRRAGLRHRAIDIEPLGHRQAVQDLLALTRALEHAADRAAWLALLRAPWCGLALADLHALVAEPSTPPARRALDNRQDLFPETLNERASPADRSIKTDMRTVWEMMHDGARLARLSGEGRQRLARVRDILEPCIANRLRGTLRARVESAWLALGGPACVSEEKDLEDAAAYLDHLESWTSGADLADARGFDESLRKLYARADLDARDDDVQLMTIHKAKGLEFDTVIVPGLGGAPRRRDPSLLLWTERSGQHGQARLLLAPVKEAGGPKDAIYDYLVRLDERAESEECTRLLYVAATRAKRELHLLGAVRRDEHGDPRAPGGGSLLAKLWPVIEASFLRESEAQPPAGRPSGEAAPTIDQRLRRLPIDWHVPPLPQPAAWLAGKPSASPREAIEFSWAGETARHVGTVVHRWLQRMAEDGLRGWDPERIAALHAAFENQLAARGVPAEMQREGAERVREALARALADERGRWLLGPRAGARSEVRIATALEGRMATVVIDRVFTDEAGVRWIVDYKTSTHEGADREQFLDRERERYRAQLERYANILGFSGARLGIYFPLLGGWREWRAP